MVFSNGTSSMAQKERALKNREKEESRKREDFQMKSMKGIEPRKLILEISSVFLG